MEHRWLQPARPQKMSRRSKDGGQVIPWVKPESICRPEEGIWFCLGSIITDTSRIGCQDGSKLGIFTILTTPWTTGNIIMNLSSSISSITVRVYLPLRILLNYLRKSYPILGIWDQNTPYLQDRRSNNCWGRLIATIKSCIWVILCWQKTNR